MDTTLWLPLLIEQGLAHLHKLASWSLLGNLLAQSSAGWITVYLIDFKLSSSPIKDLTSSPPKMGCTSTKVRGHDLCDHHLDTLCAHSSKSADTNHCDSSNYSENSVDIIYPVNNSLGRHQYEILTDVDNPTSPAHSDQGDAEDEDDGMCRGKGHGKDRSVTFSALIAQTHRLPSTDDDIPSSSYESSIIAEAHGLISDMLVDTTLPPNVVSGLRAVSNLLKPPPENHGMMHKPKVSPLVSLTEATNYSSDNEDLPYTGERPSSLPKRLRRSLPPSLIRRMSTSTWTTTTSATGLPTLEAEPCRNRSSSFRHHKDSANIASSPSPGAASSPTSNSPSPTSPTTVSLTIPKSRSFSVANIGNINTTSANNQKRNSKSLHHSHSNVETTAFYNNTSSSSNIEKSPVQAPAKKEVTNKVKDSQEKDVQPALFHKRFHITSDYESNDSPSSSDHSDNVVSTEDATPPQPMYSDTDKSTDTALNSNSNKEAPPHEDIDYNEVERKEHEVSHSSRKNSHHRVSAALGESLHDGKPSYPIEIYTPIDIELIKDNRLLDMSLLCQWDYPIFELADQDPHNILSKVICKLFMETGLFETFRIPVTEFMNYFHTLELGYREKPYHNRIHATDVLHGVYYLTSQPIPGLQNVNPAGDIFHKHGSSSESDSENERPAHKPSFTAEDTYGIMGANFPPLELLAIYAAAAMHDYDHPGRTNAFLVTTHAPLSILYNDRSVLESHHAASAWNLLVSQPKYNWLVNLDKGEFNRFRFLVIEYILATDLKRHFELVAEFNEKVNSDDATGIDWTSESDRLMVSNMVIKMADINGPCKRVDLHVSWTDRISEEFYEQGDEEASLGLAISPYMNRKNPQLAKLQESFINHLVAPLCNAICGAGLLPGTWVESETDSEDTDQDSDTKESEIENSDSVASSGSKSLKDKKISCLLTEHIKNNHDMWVVVLKQERAQKELEIEKQERELSCEKEKPDMEPIKEEETPPNSAASIDRNQPINGLPSPVTSQPAQPINTQNPDHMLTTSQLQTASNNKPSEIQAGLNHQQTLTSNT